MSARALCLATLFCVGCVAIREGPELPLAERPTVAQVVKPLLVVAVREPVLALDPVEADESLRADRYLEEVRRARKLIRLLRVTALFDEVGFAQSLDRAPDLTLVSLPRTTPEESSVAFQIANSVLMLVTVGIVPFVWPRDEGVRFARADAPMRRMRRSSSAGRGPSCTRRLSCRRS